MDIKKLLGLLETRSLGREFKYFERIDSTNDFLMREMEKLPHGFAVSAGEQIGGKGRLGRRWAAPADSSLLMSVLLRPQKSYTKPTLLPLGCGLAAARALRSMSGAYFGVKWPNDVVLSGKKICGILCESRVFPHAGASYVCGFGINLSQTAEFFSGELKNGASVKMLCGTAPSPEEAAAALLGELENVCDMLGNGEEQRILEEYSSLCVTLGRRVRAMGTKNDVEGTARAIGGDGSLAIDTQKGTVRVYAGDVSVRVGDGYV